MEKASLSMFNLEARGEARSGAGRRWRKMGCCGVAMLTLSTGCFLKPKPDVSPAAASSTVPAVSPASSEPVPSSVAPPVSDSKTGGVSPNEAGPETSPSVTAPVSPEIMPPGEAGEAFEAAVSRMKEGNPEANARALKQLETAISLDPGLVEAYFNKGIVLQRIGNNTEAEQAYRKALEGRPKLIEAYANLADLYRQQKDFTRALEVLDAGLKQAPESALLLNNRALVLRQMGSVDQAIEEVRKILKINAVDLNAFNNLGRIYLARKDYEMARLVFQKALITVSSAKDDPYIHHNLGIAYLGMKDARAQEQFERALALNGDMVEALVGRGYLHLELQEYEKAAEVLRRAVGVDPKNVTARLNLGVALRGLDELDRAELQYQEALKIDPRNVAVLMNYGILLGDYKREYQRAADVYRQLKEVAAPGPEAERVERLVKEAENNHARELKRREKERLKQEEKAPIAPENVEKKESGESATPAGHTNSTPAASNSGSAIPGSKVAAPSGGQRPAGGQSKGETSGGSTSSSEPKP